MRRVVAALALPLLAACHVRAQAPIARPALSGEGDVRVYLQPFPDDAARLSFTLAAVSAVRADGTEAPLELLLPEVARGLVNGQRLLATGRIPPGQYHGLALHVRKATVTGEHGVSNLLPPEEPVQVAVPFRIEAGRALVMRLFLGREQARAHEFQFTGAFAGEVLAPESSAVRLNAYCSTPGLASVAILDRRTREVSGILPTGRQPLGMAVDSRVPRLYVALGAQDQIQVLDLATGEELRRIALRAGDEPRELALTPDGSLLLSVNPGSNSVAFVDTASATVVATVRTGEEPSSLLLDRGGRRAYVLNRRSSDLTVIDVANRAVVATVATDPEPLRAQLSRDGTRLYVIARGSAYLTVFSLPDVTVARRVFLGLGAGALRVDPRTDLVYVGRTDEGRIQVFDPMSALPVDSIAVPGPVSQLALDDVENTLLAVLPTLGQVAFVDTTRKRLVATVDLGGEPFQVVVAGERL